MGNERVNRQLLKEKLSLETPEAKQSELMLKMFDEELNENFLDVDYDELRMAVFYLSVDEGIIPLPTIRYMILKHLSLKRSIDRKGRQEGSAILKRPVIYSPLYPYPVETKKKTSFVSKIFGKFLGHKEDREEEERY